MLKLKRVYDPPLKDDGTRVLVDRLWPRGLSKEKARIDTWLKEIAPSPGLRKWFGHDPARWTAFKKSYTKELCGKEPSIRKIRNLEKREGGVTLLYGAKDARHNHAVVLLEFLNREKRRRC